MSDTDTHIRANGRRTNGLRIALASALAVLALLALAPAASADLTFASRGAGAGQVEVPKGIAVDRSDGTLYVADYENNRIDVFDSAGNFLRAFGWGVADGTSAKLQSCTATCFKGIAGSGSGQLKEPTQVAVDNDPASPAYRDVYVLDKNLRVQRFAPAGGFVLMFGGEVNKTTHGDVCPVAPGDVCGVGLEGSAPGRFNEFNDPIAVGPGGVVYVADSRGPEPKFTGRIEKFEPTGSFIGQLVLFEGVNRVLYSLAVDSSGDFYASIERSEQGINKYDPAGTLLYTLNKGFENSGLALDAADTLFADQTEPMSRNSGDRYRLVTEYDPSGNILRRGYRPAEQWWLGGIAFFHTAAGDIFGGEGNGGEREEERIRQVALPPPGPVIAPGPVKASPVRSRKATLGAEVNPEGKATAFHYDYVDEQGFNESGFAGAEQTPDAALGADFKLHLASQDVALEPETVYHFRLIVENEDGTRTREGESFKTLPPLQIGANWATAVGTDAAILHAEVNPLESPASGYFEYVDDASFQESGFVEAHQAPDVAGGAAALDFGSGTEAVALSASLYPLTPGTTYHYRLHVEDPFLVLDGPEQTFTTFIAKPVEACPANEAFRGGASAPLPDCRAYEMVTPLDKNNGDVLVLTETFSNLPAVLNQSSVSGSRLAYGTYRAFGDAKSGPLTPQYIASRGEGGWASHGISPPRGRLFFGVFPSVDTEFKAFSPDLCEMWLRTVSEPQLAPDAIAGYPNLYRSQDSECGGLSYEALTTAAWPNVLPGDESMGNQLELQGVSADGAKAIYIAPDNLAGSGAPDLKGKGKGFTQLYISATGSTPVFACILPNGKALEASCSGGMNGPLDGRHRLAHVQGAISADGSRVFWTASGSGSGKLYMREHAEQGQVEGECTEEGVACTIAISKAAETKSGASSSGFLAAAADGSKAIFMAKGTGAPGTEAYIEDLYEYDVETQTTRLIAHEAASGPGGITGLLGVSKDASHVYFVSVQAMGGENSEGDEAQEGEPNLYLDDGSGARFIATLSDKDKRRAPSPIGLNPANTLARVSPDGLHAAFMSSAPLTGYDNTDANSGEADDEVFLYDATANGGEGKLICASCNPSGARPAGADVKFGSQRLWAAGQIPVFENTLYAARVLSDDGTRLFFESSDALVARDGNGKQDVYEWEAAGSGGCDQGDAAFSKQNEGCIDLISSGQSERNSAFVDASPSGDDVFFATLASLLPQDYGLVDIYDARVGGGYPPPPPLPPACEGDACQSPAPPPNDPTAASAGFKGPGNARPSTPARCGKGKARRKGRCVAKKQKRTKQHKRAQHRANHHQGAAR